MKKFGYKHLITALCLGGAALVAGTVYAVDDDGHFELGPVGSAVTDILGDGSAATGPDWADLFDANGLVVSGALETYGGAAAVFVADDLSTKGLTDKTTFASSNKNNDAIITWQWDTGNVPAKDDIANAYAYAKVVNDNLRIYAGIERIDAAGDSHVDIEFNQKPVGLDEAPPCKDSGSDTSPCSFIGEKTVNDIVVSMDFVIGGGIGEVTIHKWNGTEYVDVVTLNGEGCNTAFNGKAADLVCAFNNAENINGGPWQNFGKGGAFVNVLEPNAFTEFGADINELLGIEDTPCYASVNVKTRSSQSFTAELKDFAVAAFENCTATARTEIHLGDSVGPDHAATDIQGTSVPVYSVVHDKAIVTGIEGFAAPTGTVTFKRYSAADCTGSYVDETVDLAPVTGSATDAAAESSSYPTASGGAISYLATYNGDSNYPAADALCENLTVATLSSTVATDIVLATAPYTTSVLNTAVAAGTQVLDVATVQGNDANDPTGNVTFLLFANANCSGSPAATQNVTLVPDGVADGTATAKSNAFTTTTESFLSYHVVYSGDGVYDGSEASLCEPICSFEFSPAIPTP